MAVRIDRRGRLELAVADSGIGMDEAGLAKAMTPFGQVDSRLARMHEGNGLGLPIAKCITELHGGTLAIESRKGVGTTVTVRLPKQRVLNGGSAA